MASHLLLLLDNAILAAFIIIVPASIQFITADQSVVMDFSVKLRCSSVGVPAPDVIWIRNGTVLLKGRYSAILELKYVKKDHEGVYRCAVNNSQANDSAEVKVKVVGRCLNFCPKFC